MLLVMTFILILKFLKDIFFWGVGPCFKIEDVFQHAAETLLMLSINAGLTGTQVENVSTSMSEGYKFAKVYL